MPPFHIAGLGEIAIRCKDLAVMEAWYRDILGLEYLQGGHRESIVFFRIAEGVAGHTCVLALFADEARPVSGAGSSLHHFALSLSRVEQDKAMDWLRTQDEPFEVQHFAWVGWRGVFLRDPEGNTIELVAYDDAYLEDA